MGKIISRFSFLTVAIAALLIVVSACAAAPTSTGPVTTGASTPAAFKVLGIMGISEIKPSTVDNLTCVTSDDAAKDLNYTWTSADGTIQGSGRQVAWLAPETPGDYAISVKVTSGGQQDTFSRNIKVTTNPFNNDQPDQTIYLKLTLPSTDIVKEGRTIRVWTTEEIQCDVAGSNPADLTYTWTIPGGKLAGNGLSEGKANKVGWIAPGEASDYIVSVVVADKFGNSARGEVDFTVFCCHPPVDSPNN
jgi:hypothetical protein